MRSTLVDFYLRRNQSPFLQLEEFEEVLDLARKCLKALEFDKRWVRMQDRRRKAILVEAGRFQISKRSDCPNGRSANRGVRLFPAILLCI